jgi:two-component system, chemotaxis family, protein-glutamate methylesterase/glutaminase
MRFFAPRPIIHGSRVIGALLSGTLDDGTSGLWTVTRLGGTTIVQDPREASFDSMPLCAIEQVEIDHILTIGEIGPLIVRLTKSISSDTKSPPADLVDRMQIEVEVAASGETEERARELQNLAVRHEHLSQDALIDPTPGFKPHDE